MSTRLEKALALVREQVTNEARAARALIDVHREGIYHVTQRSLGAAQHRLDRAQADIRLLAIIDELALKEVE